MKILLATGNKGKLKEMQALFTSANLNNIELMSLADVEKVEEPEETGTTFQENAYIKAMYYYKIYQIPVICDDTGLCVDYLNGAPGINTARYGSINGEHTDPVKNYMRIIDELGNTNNRKCHFTTAMYFYDGKVLISSLGQMDGTIALKPSGNEGFGYDPIFYIPDLKCTVATLDAKQKNEISHRGKASRMLIAQLKQYLN